MPFSLFKSVRLLANSTYQAVQALGSTSHKSPRKREKFLKSGKGRKWLDSLETTPEPAKKPAGKASP
jgi:hypothetical protein